MTTNRELVAEMDKLRMLLAAHGIQEPVEAMPLTERPDYIAFGSPEHAQFLGLVEVGDKDETFTMATFTSPRSKKTFRLEDDMGATRFYPSIDPEKAIVLVLQQKVNELETAPEVPADAPAMFVPAEVYPT